ncbi:hypothetical protein [Candidatus Thiodictyon syntrophicum]|nr:hypothetical protein [Candidatus Thiodictyon syntrophicum]
MIQPVDHRCDGTRERRALGGAPARNLGTSVSIAALALALAGPAQAITCGFGQQYFRQEVSRFCPSLISCPDGNCDTTCQVTYEEGCRDLDLTGPLRLNRIEEQRTEPVDRPPDGQNEHSAITPRLLGPTTTPDSAPLLSGSQVEWNPITFIGPQMTLVFGDGLIPDAVIDRTLTVESGGIAVPKVAGFEVLDAQVIVARGDAIETGDLLVQRQTELPPASGAQNGKLSLFDTPLKTDVLRVGETARGEIAVRRGASLELLTESPFNIIGGRAGSNGLVKVDMGGTFAVAERVGLVLGADAGRAGASTDGEALAAARGEIAVSGAGSGFNGRGEIIAGALGQGFVTVTEGATFVAPDLVLGAFSETTTGSAGVQTRFGTGTLTLDGAGTRADIGGLVAGGANPEQLDGVTTLSNRLVVGRAGIGQAQLSNGAVLDTFRLIVGQEEGGTGSVAVGTGATLDAGLVGIGVAGTGTVQVAAGGTLKAQGGGIGWDDDGQGTLSIGGTGALFEMGGDGAFMVGHRGQGLLDVAAGGLVRLSSDAGILGVGGIDTLPGLGGQGTVRVRSGGRIEGGENSAIIFGGNATATATGHLQVDSGAALDLGLLRVGTYGGSGIQATVDIRGSADFSFQGTSADPDALGAMVAQAVEVGARGQVRVLDGGHLSAPGLSIGAALADGQPLVEVTGAGSRMDIANNIAVGIQGRGKLRVSGEGAAVTAKGVYVGNVSGLLDPDAIVTPLAGVLEVSATGRLTTTQGVFIGAGGQFFGSGGSVVGPTFQVMAGGALRPGLSPGHLTLAGDLFLDAGGLLEIEIGGANPGVGFDLLSVTGDVHLGGTLLLAFIDGFLPKVGDRFDFLDLGGGLFGDFDEVLISGAPGLGFDPAALRLGILTVTEAAAPAPSTLALLLLGALGRYWRPGRGRADHPGQYR